jgi:adenylate cyclase 3
MLKFELMSRRLFLWQKDVDEQKEKVADMRRKNEALVYNILPPHVAIHFLGKRKNDEVIKAYNHISANK